ncbi:MAG: SDR family oxidoreductase, partial [Planctomycetaceae bacterium]
DEADGPLRETSPPSPRGVYATSKYEGERLAAACPRHLILRTCGLYGEVTRSGNFVQTMLRLGRQGKPLRVVNDQRCNPTSTSVLAEAAGALMAAGHVGTFHVVSAPPVTWYEFAEEIFRRAGIDVDMVPITTQEYGARAPRPRYSVLDTSKYTRVTGRSIPSISDSLQQYLAEYGGITFT